jgi:hypothetical protein
MTGGQISLCTNPTAASAPIKYLRVGGGSVSTQNGANFVGNLTGNVAGNCSGSTATFTGSLSGDITGTMNSTQIASQCEIGRRKQHWILVWVLANIK